MNVQHPNINSYNQPCFFMPLLVAVGMIKNETEIEVRKEKFKKSEAWQKNLSKLFGRYV